MIFARQPIFGTSISIFCFFHFCATVFTRDLHEWDFCCVVNHSFFRAPEYSLENRDSDTENCLSWRCLFHLSSVTKSQDYSRLMLYYDTKEQKKMWSPRGNSHWQRKARRHGVVTTTKEARTIWENWVSQSNILDTTTSSSPSSSGKNSVAFDAFSVASPIHLKNTRQNEPNNSTDLTVLSQFLALLATKNPGKTA